MSISDEYAVVGGLLRVMDWLILIGKILFFILINFSPFYYFSFYNKSRLCPIILLNICSNYLITTSIQPTNLFKLCCNISNVFCKKNTLSLCNYYYAILIIATIKLPKFYTLFSPIINKYYYSCRIESYYFIFICYYKMTVEVVDCKVSFFVGYRLISL